MPKKNKIKKKCSHTPEFVERCITVPSRVESTQFFGNQTVPSANIYTRIVGSTSNPVVFFCSDTNFSSDMWRCQEVFVAQQGFCSVTVDLRGLGRSSKTPANPDISSPPTPGTINYVYETFANDIYCVLNILGLCKPFVWVGVSTGAGIGIRYFSLYNNSPFGPKIKQLFLINTSPVLVVPDCSFDPACTALTCPPDPITGNQLCFPQALIPESLLQSFNFLIQNDFALFSQTLIDIVATDCPDVIAPVKAYLTSAINVNVPSITLNLFNTLFRQDLRSILPTINIPTLVWRGYPQFAPGSQYIADNIRCAVSVVGTDEGLFPHMTNFTTFNCILWRFLEKMPFFPITTIPAKQCNVCPLIGPINYASQQCFP